MLLTGILLFGLLLSGCAGEPSQPLPANEQAYWDAINGVPGA